MDFFNSAVGVLQTLVIALGAGLGIWGAINLMEGYGAFYYFKIMKPKKDAAKGSSNLDDLDFDEDDEDEEELETEQEDEKV